MKGLKIIPAFFFLIVLTYFGVQFVEANREEVFVNLGNWQSRPVSLGFVLITSFFFGTLFSALLSATEMMRLYIENSRLKRKYSELQTLASSKESTMDTGSLTPSSSESTSGVSRPTGRFS